MGASMLRWTIHKYLCLNLVVLLTALSWPSLAYAAGLQTWAITYNWELIVLGLFISIPFGAWLGVSIPPPTGHEEVERWPKIARVASGLFMGTCTAMYLGSIMNPLAITIIPPSVLSAVCGASLLSARRKKIMGESEND